MTFTQWQEYIAKVDAIAKRVKAMQDDRARKIAESVGVPFDGCCLHNAAIDTDMTGWCKGRPDRLKAAKQANHIATDWKASRLAGAISKAAWARIN